STGAVRGFPEEEPAAGFFCSLQPVKKHKQATANKNVVAFFMRWPACLFGFDESAALRLTIKTISARRSSQQHQRPRQRHRRRLSSRNQRSQQQPVRASPS